ncbi:Fic family protein [Staphylococcus arlettae]|nr:Fic family protein [Staphylococcus arlettae]RIM58336.1 Fic family protein [Staphylococcus arlettae]
MDFMYKFFYKNPQEYEKEYEKRMNAPNVELLELKIRPYKSNAEFELYYIPTSKILNLVNDIEKNNSKLIEHTINLPEAATESLHKDIIVNELFSTNQIEGVKSSKQEIVHSMKEIKENPKKTVRFKSMLNSYLGILYEENDLPKEPKDIKRIYKMIAEEEVNENDKLDGDLFRQEVVKVVTSTDKIIHEGVTPHSKIIKYLQKLLNFLNTPNNIAPVIKVAISHYYMGYIHPFYDGNGRTSRFINSLYLDKEYDKLTAISLSRAIDNNKKTYYDMFDKTNSVMNKGELNYFIDNFLTFIKEGQKGLIEELLMKKAQLYHASQKIGNDNILNSLTENHRRIMFILAQIQYFSLEESTTVQELSIYLKVSHQTTRKLLNELIELEYIDKSGIRPALYKSIEGYF